MKNSDALRKDGGAGGVFPRGTLSAVAEEAAGLHDEKFWQEGLDGKRLVLCLFRKIWILPAAGMAGAILAVGIYLLHALILAGPPEYQVFSQYRIYFDSEKYGEIQDYYNAYTWGEIMRTDQVLDFVMEALPETVTKEQVRAAVSVGQMNDIRLMPLLVTTQDAALSETIARAYRSGLPRFAQALVGLTDMECWQMELSEVPRATKTGNVGLFGFLLGVSGAFFLLLLYVCLDDSVYLEEDLAGRYAWPVFGTITRKRDKALLCELRTNLAGLPEGKEKLWLAGPEPNAGAEVLEEVAGELLPVCHRASWPLCPQEATGMRESGVLLLLPWGAHNGRWIRHMVLQFEKQQVEILGAVLYDASDWFCRGYYGAGRQGMFRCGKV